MTGSHFEAKVLTDSGVLDQIYARIEHHGSNDQKDCVMKVAEQNQEQQDPECICKGNWRAIIAETEPLLDKKFRDREGKVFILYGVVHGSDDYFYGLLPVEEGKAVLLSCVCSIESYGYTLMANN
jgi:hypothetical protein